MKLSEVIERLTRIESDQGDIEATRIGWVEGDNGWQVYVNYE